MLDDSHTCASMQCVHVINGCTKDPEMTESNLGWRLVREIFLWLICVSFCGYLYEEISSRQFPSMCPLLSQSEVLLSRCQVEEKELSLDCTLLDSMTGHLCTLLSSETVKHCMMDCLDFYKVFRAAVSFVPPSGEHPEHRSSASVCLLIASTFFGCRKK